MLSTHSSGVTCEPRCYLTLSAGCMRTDKYFIFVWNEACSSCGDTTRCTLQNLVGRASRRSGFVHPWLRNLKRNTFITDYSTVTSYLAFGRSLERILRTCNLTEELVSLRPSPFYHAQIIERLCFWIACRRYPVKVRTLEPAIQCVR
jgi:hypothetical protein